MMISEQHDGTMESVGCLNCAATFHGRYCHRCGQKIPTRLTIPGVLGNSLNQLLELDSAMLRTVLGLTARPGRLAREYVVGRRAAYMNPLKYAFLATTMYILLVTILQDRTDLLDEHPVHPLALLSVYVAYLGWGPDGFPALSFGMAAARHIDWFVHLLPYATFFFLVPLAPLQLRLFRRDSVNVAECYAFQIYAVGHLMLVHLVLIGSGFYRSTPGYLAAHLLELGFMAWGLAGFHGSSLIRSVAGAVLLIVSYRVLFAAAFFLVLSAAA
jgi:hypothetical protein